MLLLFAIPQEINYDGGIIPGKVEKKKTLGSRCSEYFWSIHKHFLELAFAIQKRKNYNFAMLIIY